MAEAEIVGDPSRAHPTAGEAAEGNSDRRRFLGCALGCACGLGAGAFAWPLLSSMSPSIKARALGGPVEADVSGLGEGDLVTYEWRGKPVWILRRDQESLTRLKRNESHLLDPDSQEAQQPEYARNKHRSIKPEYAVLIGLCTHLSCSPTYRPDVGAPDIGSDWEGGFLCPCHGSLFDVAGRVYKGVPAPLNLEVPPHRFASDTLVIIGDDGDDGGESA